MQLPRSREFRHVRELDGELVIVDEVLDVAHRLRPEAARVWRACDGASDAAAIADTAQVPRPTADAALVELDRLGLLEAPGAGALDTRRSMLRKAAVAGAGVSAGLTLVSSVLLPTPAQAFESRHGEGGGQGAGGEGGDGGQGGEGAGAPVGVLGETIHKTKHHRRKHHRRKHHRHHKPHGKHHHHKAKSHRKHRRHG
jgi:hypothetical protein